MSNVEIEVRFPAIDVDTLMQRLQTLDTQDLGERFFKETIFHGSNESWAQDHRRVRVRHHGDITTLTYKAGSGVGMHTVEQELVVNDYDTACAFLLGCDLQQVRVQEKKRHSFKLGECLVEFDSWPGIPTYIEIEGSSVEALQATAQKLNLDWQARYEGNALTLTKEWYGLDLQSVQEFTFGNFPEQRNKII